MPNVVESLDVMVWEPDFPPGTTLKLQRFRLASDAQATLAQWSREKSGRTLEPHSALRLDGLSEILAWFVPEIAFVRHDLWIVETGSRHLALFMAENAAAPDLRSRVRAGIASWLTLIYPDKLAEMRTAIAETAMADESWAVIEIGCDVRKPATACAVPEHAMFFDAVAARALSSLAGQRLSFRSGVERVLIAKTAHSSAFRGLELVSFPPRQGQRGLFSEVITLFTPTYPERDHVHILARPSIRNWGPVTRWAQSNDPNRSLDIFLPSGESYRHSSFDFQARRGPAPVDGGRPPIIGIWPHRDEQRVFDLVRRFTGRATLAPEELATPVIDQDGLWVLPRLGTLHQDDRLAGGSGISWPDRQDIAASLGTALSEAGFKAAEPLKYVRTRMPLDKPFNSKDSESSFAARRRAVRDALAANDIVDDVLHLFLFLRLDDTPARVSAALIAELGQPQTHEPDRLSWPDGLAVQLHLAKAGPLGERVSWEDITPEQAKKHGVGQQAALRRLQRATAYDKAKADMLQHVSQACPQAVTLGCAIVEIAEAHRAVSGDPFQLARNAIAQCQLLPQVVLTQTEPPSEATLKAKYGSAVSDCFRMLGVLPVAALPDDMFPAALTVVQRNSEIVAGEQRKGHAFPLAARIREGRLECAIPEESGAPIWAPYAKVALKILCGDYGKFGRGRQEENIGKFETFFLTALEDIARCGAALVICEGDTLTHKLDALSNKRLTFDQLAIANRILTPQDLPGLRVVRTSPDARRQPYYYHDQTNTWPSGLFRWGDAKRTFYGLKQKPVTVSSKQHFSSRQSRHGDAEAGQSMKEGVGIVASQLDEICLVFAQADDDPLTLATLVHRLRGAHAQYGGDTARPFPLHELRRLGGGVTF